MGFSSSKSSNNVSNLDVQYDPDTVEVIVDDNDQFTEYITQLNQQSDDSCKTSEEWYCSKYCKEYYITKPDGWTNAAQDFEGRRTYWYTQPITETEFRQRVKTSTLRLHRSPLQSIPGSGPILHPFRDSSTSPPQPRRHPSRDSLQILRRNRSQRSLENVHTQRLCPACGVSLTDPADGA